MSVGNSNLYDSKLILSTIIIKCCNRSVKNSRCFLQFNSLTKMCSIFQCVLKLFSYKILLMQIGKHGKSTLSIKAFIFLHILIIFIDIIPKFIYIDLRSEQGSNCNVFLYYVSTFGHFPTYI